MKNQDIFFIFICLMSFTFCVSATENASVYINAFQEENFALMRCDVSGDCYYYNQSDKIPLPYNSDWIIKITASNYSAQKFMYDFYHITDTNKIVLVFESLFWLCFVFIIYKYAIKFFV